MLKVEGNLMHMVVAMCFIFLQYVEWDAVLLWLQDMRSHIWVPPGSLFHSNNSTHKPDIAQGLLCSQISETGVFDGWNGTKGVSANQIPDIVRRARKHNQCGDVMRKHWTGLYWLMWNVVFSLNCKNTIDHSLHGTMETLCFINYMMVYYIWVCEWFAEINGMHWMVCWKVVWKGMVCLCTYIFNILNYN